MSTLRIIFIWLAMLLIAIAVAACGADPTPTPQPTATPVPTPTPTETPLMVADLRIDPQTTGSQLISRIAEAEAACLNSAMGDSNFDLFQQAPLMGAVSEEGAYDLLANCLEADNLIVLGVGLISAKNGGWEPNSLECVTAVSREHPEMVYYAFGIASRIPELDHAGAHAEFPTIYQCLTAVEQVTFHSVIQSTGVQFSGQNFLNILPEADLECLRNTLTEQEFSELAESPAPLANPDEEVFPKILSCASPEAFALIPTEIIMVNFGAESEPSRNCMRQVFSEQESLIQLLTEGAQLAETLTPEEYSETAQGVFLLLECLTEEEILFFQELHMPSLVP